MGHKKVARGSWNTIVTKMEGAGRGLFENEVRRKTGKKMYDFVGVVFTTSFVYYLYELIIRAFTGA
jgi:hypothetical protein